MSKIRILDEEDVRAITNEEIDEIIESVPNYGGSEDDEDIELPEDYEGIATDEDIFNILDS